MSSTTSSESAPRSATKCAVGVTSASSTPSCSTMMCLTFSSGEAISLLLLTRGGGGILALAPTRVKRVGNACITSDRSRCVGPSPAAFERLALLSRHVHPAVDVQHVPGDVARLVGGEEPDALQIGRASCRERV